MNYEKIYNQIIERAKTRKLTCYKERHHIIPRCMSGGNDKTNMVELTAREHFICHKLLTLIHPSEHKLKYAFWMMCITGGKHYQRIKPSSRDYESIRNQISILKTGRKTGKRDKEFCKRISLDKKGRKVINKNNIEKNVKPEVLESYLQTGWVLGRTLENKRKISLNNNKKGNRKKMSEAQKLKISISKTGKSLPPKTKEQKLKMSLQRKGIPSGRKGIPLSKETKTNIGLAHKNRKFIMKDGIQKKVPLIELDKYLKEGWVLGKVFIYKGHKLSEEHKLKLLQSRANKQVTKETRRKIGLKHKGKIISKEVREKMSIAHKGKRLSEEHKNKIRISILQAKIKNINEAIEGDADLKIFDSQKELLNKVRQQKKK